MKNSFLFILVLCLLTLSTYAQPLSGPYPTPVTAQTIAQAGGVTNGAPAVFGFTNYTTLNNSSFDLSNCTYFPFLNGHWTNDLQNGWFVHNLTNFAYNDTTVTKLGWVFATNFPPAADFHNVFLIDQNLSGTLAWNVPNNWMLNDASTFDTAYITNNNIFSTVTTNLGVATQVVSHANTLGNNSIIDKWTDSGGQLLFDIECSSVNDQISYGRWAMWCTPFGVPWTNGCPGFVSLYTMGGLTTPGLTDPRGQVDVGVMFGVQGQYGGAHEFLVKRDTTYHFGSSGAGNFERSLVLDSHGGVQLGNTSSGMHTFKDDAPAWAEVWGGTTDKPAMLITSFGTGKKYTGTVTNGAIDCDGTNVWITQNGFSSPVAPAYFQTNTASPVAALAGIGQLFIGGPGGTNLYLVIKTAGGVLATNKFTPSGQWP